ncbi:hypothetical protein BU17DRAFT_56797, partial [Hysterangium stoloniferum]
VREYAGDTFFDDNLWTYYGLFDNLTNGDVIYVDRDTAMNGGLTYVSGQSTAIIRVDNYTTVPFNFKRNTVRITSNDFYDQGSLWIFDAIHLPFGCSVWPAWWSKATTSPYTTIGEIDIIENINLAQTNQMALHTTPGCFHTSAPAQPGASGADPDCSTPSGCLVSDLDPRSWGQNFAAAGGGIFATQFDFTGIYIWFWSRADVPATLLPSAQVTPLDISQWGPPTASYLAATCNISQFFTPQQLVLNIDLCVTRRAGVPSIYQSTCGNEPPNDPTNPVSSQNPRIPACYADNVVGPGSRYDNAYFEINHIRTYTTVVASTATPASANLPNVGVIGNQPSANDAARTLPVPSVVAWIIRAITSLISHGPSSSTRAIEFGPIKHYLLSCFHIMSYLCIMDLWRAEVEEEDYVAPTGFRST